MIISELSLLVEVCSICRKCGPKNVFLKNTKQCLQVLQLIIMATHFNIYSQLICCFHTETEVKSAVRLHNMSTCLNAREHIWVRFCCTRKCFRNYFRFLIFLFKMWLNPTFSSPIPLRCCPQRLTTAEKREILAKYEI